MSQNDPNSGLDIEQLILDTINTSESLRTDDFADKLGVSHQAIVGSLKSLESGKLVSSQMETKSRWKFTDEARDIIAHGSPEGELWALLKDGPQERKALEAKMGKKLDIAMKNGMKNKLFKLNKTDGKQILERAEGAQFRDVAQEKLRAADKGEQVSDADADMLKKRKLATVEQVKVFTATKGQQFTTKRVKPVSDITRDMMLDGSWETATFKQYTLERAEGREPLGGQLHPLLKVRQEFREIFLELGFQEMDTTAWVESSFWNFDTLFVPQNHPARDSQDTFYVSKPEKSKTTPSADYIQHVKNIHEASYCTKWSEEESAKNVLRTHTTGVSSWVLRHLAQASPLGADGKRQFTPGKYFSIDRVFRNEEMDRTHLCEFHQIEGFIVDRNLSLANMMHTLHQFFKRIGIEKLRFKPAFNPYTEPSMEIFGYHAGMKKWMEVGNSGMFRPEMLQPMGFDKDVTAIAWGLSLERPTMIKYGINNIHELFGHKVDLKFIRRSKIARY